MRSLWLKQQYLLLYYDSEKCAGPTPADAIKVRAEWGRMACRCEGCLELVNVVFGLEIGGWCARVGDLSKGGCCVWFRDW